MANVTPIFKGKGDKNDICNYRPISVLPVMSKILEKVVQAQLVYHLESNCLLNINQSGFRSNHSTQDVLVNVTDSWRKSIVKGEFVGAVFLDLAFDCVNHDIILSKLPFYGIGGDALHWFHSYLSNRSQRVCVDDNLSSWGSITSGVPQGSILGPLLFVLYINDMPHIVEHSHVNIYADDTEIHASSPDLDLLHSKLQNDLDTLQVWLAVNKLKVNTLKTQCMLIGTPQRIRG